MNLKTFLKLTRLEHSFLIIIAVAVGELIITREIPIAASLLGFLSAGLIQIGSFTAGDYFDIAADRANKRKDRPLATGEAKPREAIAIAAVSFIIGITAAYFVNQIIFLIAAAFAVLGFLYGCILKKIPLIGNLAIAATMAIPFIFGNYIVSPTISYSVLVLAATAFFLGVGREIIISMRDVKGDKKAGRKTLPMLIGEKKSVYFAEVMFALAICFTAVPFLYIKQYYADYTYLVPILAADLITLYCIALLRLQEYRKIRNLTLVAMLVALIGFLAGAVI